MHELFSDTKMKSPFSRGCQRWQRSLTSGEDLKHCIVDGREVPTDIRILDHNEAKNLRGRKAT